MQSPTFFGHQKHHFDLKLPRTLLKTGYGHGAPKMPGASRGFLHPSNRKSLLYAKAESLQENSRLSLAPDVPPAWLAQYDSLVTIYLPFFFPRGPNPNVHLPRMGRSDIATGGEAFTWRGADPRTMTFISSPASFEARVSIPYYLHRAYDRHMFHSRGQVEVIDTHAQGSPPQA